MYFCVRLRSRLQLIVTMAKDEKKLSKKAAEADSPAKDKKEKKVKEEVAVDTVGDVSMGDAEKEDKATELSPEALIPIAHPLADKSLTKKVFKTIKKASKNRGHVKRGVKEVVKGLRKGEKGLVVLAGDISPIDILSHIPVLCEDASNPYLYVASKDQLGNASSTKRPTSCVMIVPAGGKKAIEKGDTKVKEDYQEEYSTVHKEASRLVQRLLLG